MFGFGFSFGEVAPVSLDSIQMGWGNIYKRRLKVFTVALFIYFDYKVCLSYDVKFFLLVWTTI